MYANSKCVKCGQCFFVYLDSTLSPPTTTPQGGAVSTILPAARLPSPPSALPAPPAPPPPPPPPPHNVSVNHQIVATCFNGGCCWLFGRQGRCPRGDRFASALYLTFFFGCGFGLSARPVDRQNLQPPQGASAFPVATPSNWTSNVSSNAGSSVEAPDEYCCPISHEVMRDPVVLVETRRTYERSCIENWFANGHSSCPLTGTR